MTTHRRFTLRFFWGIALLALTANCSGGGAATSTLPSASSVASSIGGTPAIASVAAAVIPPYVAAVLSDVPIAYFRLNTPVSLSFPDATGNGHKASITGTPAFLQGNVLPQSGTSNSVSFAKGYASDNATWTQNAVTVEAWIKPTANDLGPNFSPRLVGNAWADHSGNGFMLWISGGYASFNAGYHSIVAPAPLTAGQAYHLVGIYDPTNATNAVQLYVNGVLVVGATVNGGAPTVNVGDSTKTYFGVLDAAPQYGFVDAFGGLMSEVAVYDHAVPPADILTHFQLGFGGGATPTPTPTAMPSATPTSTPTATPTSVPTPGIVSAAPAALAFTQSGAAAAQSITASQSGGSGSFTAAATGGDPTAITLTVSGATITVTPVHAGATSIVITGSGAKAITVPVGVTLTSIGIQ